MTLIPYWDWVKLVHLGRQLVAPPPDKHIVFKLLKETEDINLHIYKSLISIWREAPPFGIKETL